MRFRARVTACRARRWLRALTGISVSALSSSHRWRREVSPSKLLSGTREMRLASRRLREGTGRVWARQRPRLHSLAPQVPAPSTPARGPLCRASLLLTRCWSTALGHSAPHAPAPRLRHGSPALRTLAPSPVRSGAGPESNDGLPPTWGEPHPRTRPRRGLPRAAGQSLAPGPSAPVPRHPSSPAPLLLGSPGPLPPRILVPRDPGPRDPCPSGSGASCQTGLPAWLLPMGAVGYWTGRQSEDRLSAHSRASERWRTSDASSGRLCQLSRTRRQAVPASQDCAQAFTPCLLAWSLG